MSRFCTYQVLRAYLNGSIELKILQELSIPLDIMDIGLNIHILKTSSSFKKEAYMIKL